jgi:predicted flap endonuclease-1-like 5' DNA nuclease
MVAETQGRQGMANLIEIAGIGRHQAERMQSLGIATQVELLAACATPAGRAGLCSKTGCTMEQILTWANRADLARVSGIDEDCADLLEAAGVDTVPELAQRNAANLHARLVEVNDERIISQAVPASDEIARWVAEAKALPRMLQY